MCMEELIYKALFLSESIGPSIQGSSFSPLILFVVFYAPIMPAFFLKILPVRPRLVILIDPATSPAA